MAELNIFGFIGKRYSYLEDRIVGTDTKDVASFLEDNKTAPSLDININSMGGSSFEGIAIYNTIRKFADSRRLQDPNFKIRTTNMAAALSAGSIIFLSGDDRICYLGSHVMIHCCHGEVVGNADDLRAMANSYDVTDSAVAQLYADVCKSKSEKDFLKLMRSETWFDPQSALEVGLCTEMSAHTSPEMSFPFEHGSYRKYIEKFFMPPERKSDANEKPIDRSKEFKLEFENLMLEIGSH